MKKIPAFQCKQSCCTSTVALHISRVMSPGKSIEFMATWEEEREKIIILSMNVLRSSAVHRE